jgi:hypothetical protein
MTMRPKWFDEIVLKVIREKQAGGTIQSGGGNVFKPLNL